MPSPWCALHDVRTIVLLLGRFCRCLNFYVSRFQKKLFICFNFNLHGRNAVSKGKGRPHNEILLIVASFLHFSSTFVSFSITIVLPAKNEVRLVSFCCFIYCLFICSLFFFFCDEQRSGRGALWWDCKEREGKGTIGWDERQTQRDRA